MLFSYTQVAFANSTDSVQATSGVTNDTEVSKLVANGVDDIDVQLNDLYREVGRNLNIDYLYVKILHLIAGGKAVYADKRPNIYAELTVNSMDAPFQISGAAGKQEFNAQAPWAIMPDETVERPNKYYMPDAAYSATSEVVKLMNKRYYKDRGQFQEYFDSLGKDVKTNIVFCEAVLEYIGSSSEAVESFYTTYENILYEKDGNENVFESNNDGTFTIKDKFRGILEANNLSDPRDIEVLSIILSFDSKLAASSSPDTLKEESTMPYKLNYTSRENMMLAAMSVVGKVRYVWGGGHLGTGALDGISPAWKAFYDTYPTEEETVVEGEITGFNNCIKPTSSWCPIHGGIEDANSCLGASKTVYSVEEYVDTRKEIMDTRGLEGTQYAGMIEQAVSFEHGVVGHRLDGLDCSGYTSWVFNQITDSSVYDSGAKSFISASGLQSVEYGEKMLPGDVFSWGEHIVLIVGQAETSGRAYVMIEASPNTVKFGVVHYGDAEQSEINLAVNIAREANSLIGNLGITERTNIYNMDTQGFNADEPEIPRYAEIGRFNKEFLDENIVVKDNKKIKDMTAREIIQYTLDNLSEQYIGGLESYEGEIYSVKKTSAVEIMELDIEGLTGELSGDKNEQ